MWVGKALKFNKRRLGCFESPRPYNTYSKDVMMRNIATNYQYNPKNNSMQKWQKWGREQL